jgi:transposase
MSRLECDSVHAFDSFGLGSWMRGEDMHAEHLFSYVRLETRIPTDHPLRAIRELVDAALKDLSRSFDRLYSREGRPSIPPERLLRALLLQAFYTVRSERQLMEQLDYNLLFRWFVGLSADDSVWDATVFCKNRDRLLDGDIAAKFFTSVLNLPQVSKLLSSEHFSVDGTLIEAWASMKSFVPKDDDGKPPADKGGGGRNAERNFHGQKRKNDTHSSTTDPDARLFRKGAGKEAKLCHMGHLMTENRNGLIVDARLTEANGTAERTTALDMIEDNANPGSTVGGDKNYDTADFVAGCRERGCTPHVSQNNTNRRSAIDARTTRHPGYRISTIKRKRIEEPFGWMKTVGGLRKTRHRRRGLVEWFFVLTAAAYNLVRIPKILAATG